MRQGARSRGFHQNDQAGSARGGEQDPNEGGGVALDVILCPSLRNLRSRLTRRRGMATQTESVVTPERYNQGISYKEWMEQIDRNQARFVENYDGFTPDPADIEKIKALVARGAT